MKRLLMLATISGAVGWLAVLGMGDTRMIPPPSGAPRRAAIQTPSGTRLIAIRTGWVRIKEPHFRYAPPRLLIVPRIFASRRWHEWLPIISYVIVAGDETVLVDTGAAPQIADPSYMACDAANRFFYGRNMRFSVDPLETIDRQLLEIGIDPTTVSTVVVTHFHGDHSGRLDAFPRARVVTGRGNWPSHVGSVPCTLPKGFRPELAQLVDEPVGVFGRSARLTVGGEVRLVPLYGHTPGHVGVLVSDAGRHWLIAGDATFDAEHTHAGDVAGVSENIEQARATQELIARQLAELDTVLLPAHDPSVFARLAD